MTATTHLQLKQGTTWSQVWQVTNYDLTDATWTAHSQVRRTRNSAEVLHTFATAFDGTDLVTIMATPTESSAWEWTAGVYDVELHSDDGRVLRIAEGGVTVSREVTRDV